MPIGIDALSNTHPGKQHEDATRQERFLSLCPMPVAQHLSLSLVRLLHSEIADRTTPMRTPEPCKKITEKPYLYSH